MIKEFASLHGHSHFSFFDGLSTPEENVLAAKAKGLKSIALTDHGVTHGHADFYLAGKKHGVRTIFGCEAYVIHSHEEWSAIKQKNEELKALKKKGAASEDPADSKILRRKGHLVILACDREGLANLYDLNYRAFRDGFYGKPRMDKAMLREKAKGLIASSACMGGVISKAVWDYKDGKSSWEDVRREALEFDSIFGRGRFFLEIQLNEHKSQKVINQAMVQLSEETGIPLTVTTDFHYSKAEEWEAREVLHMLDWDKTIKDMPLGKIDAEIKQLYVKSPEEMWNTYLAYGKDHIDEKTILRAFEGTLLADSLVSNFEPDTHVRLPTLPYQDPFVEMKNRAVDGLKKLGLWERDEYRAQLAKELRLVREKGFSNYFLITQKIVEAAKEEMLVGAGRGSAAGSLICYALGITDLDPLQYDLMFERFLDPSRSDIPDIDVDFENVGQTKEMLRKMFGRDNVACLSTYGTFQIKGLLQDLCRVFDVPHEEVTAVNKQIQKELRALYGAGEDKSSITIRLEDVIRVCPSYNAFVKKYPQVGAHVAALYGRNRHIGRHASGVVIGDDLPRETSLLVTTKDPDDVEEVEDRVVQTSFTEGIVNKNMQAMGFVKFDVLSIATLKIIHQAFRFVAKKTGKTVKQLREEYRPKNLDLNDQKVLKHVFWHNHMGGVFQFSGNGIRRLAMQVKPDSFEDISAITSLYRPGPLASGMCELFVQNKRNPDQVTYEHPIMKELMEKTRGTMIYQEQLMLLCNRLGKMELKDVQRIRKNLLKKIKGRSIEFLKAENAELSAKFIKGCVENGLTEERAKQWWENILGWGSYGFNASHSKTYSVMTMQCAHLATYYPLEFYAAVLMKGQSADLQDYVDDIKKCGIKVLSVDVQHSKEEPTIEGQDIRLSSESVTGVGKAAAAKIGAAAPYTGFFDFLDRSGSTKTSTLPLIRVGALKNVPGCGNIRAIEQFYLFVTGDKKLGIKGDPKLLQKKNRPQAEELLAKYVAEYESKPMSAAEAIAHEIELLGFSAQGNPFEVLGRTAKIEQVFGENELTYQQLVENDDLECGMLPVLVKEAKERAQKNGQMFAFVKMRCRDGTEFEAPAFANVWKWTKPNFQKGKVLIVTLSKKKDDPEALVVGKPGWAQSQKSAEEAVIDLDSLAI